MFIVINDKWLDFAKLCVQLESRADKKGSKDLRTKLQNVISFTQSKSCKPNLTLNLMRGNAAMLTTRGPDDDIPEARVDGRVSVKNQYLTTFEYPCLFVTSL